MMAGCLLCSDGLSEVLSLGCAGKRSECDMQFRVCQQHE